MRVVLSLEELGVSWTPGDPVPLLQTAGAASYVQGRVLAIEERHQQAGAADVKAKDLPSAGPKESNSVNEPQQGEPNLPKMVPSTEELETAYELEMWKAEQEKKWRAELREREAERLSILESEWRHRESLRDAEFSARKEAYGKLEARAREVLKEMAAREAKLVAAEEAAASRRGELERAAATRISEAEAAVRRLQVECEHQLDLERHRNEELARAKAAAEERLRAAEARADAVEVAFQQYRDSQRHSPESELQAKLSEAQSALRQAEAKAREAIFAKGRYKEQVVKLAKELAALQKARAEEQSQLLASRLSHMDDITTRRISSSQAKMSRVQASELGALRLQLEELRKSAAAAQRAVVSNGKENSNPQLSTSPPRPQTAEAAAPDLPEIQRLQKERASLLDTGMYDAGDPLIQEIDRQMQALQDPRPQR